MDISPLDFSAHGILQARILEWVAIFFSTRMLSTHQLFANCPFFSGEIDIGKHVGTSLIIKYIGIMITV